MTASVPGAVGDRVGPVEHAITVTAIVRYAGAAADFTPVHHDPAVAAEAGVDRLFAMGMLSAGFLGSLVEDTFGIGAVEEFAVRFRDRVWVGESVSCSATVTAADPERIHLALEVVAGDRVVIDGTAVVRTAGLP